MEHWPFLDRDSRYGLGISVAIAVLLLPPLFAIGIVKSGSLLLLSFVLLFTLGSVFFYFGKQFVTRLHVIFQFTKFCLIGGLSTSIELSFLNIAFLLTGITSGVGFSIFKAATFCVALGNSYYFNKHWAFEAKEIPISKEFIKFFISNMVGLVINVGVASVVVNAITPPHFVSSTLWANIGAATAVAATMFWNFLSYRYLVFRKQ